MDPYTLLKVLWRHKLLALPVIALVILGAGYVFLFGPRTYESSAVYVVVNPNPPTDREIARDSRLSRLNSDNPYLRAADPSLIVKVLSAKMASQETQKSLEIQQLSTEYSVAQSPLSTMTLIITAAAPSPELAITTRDWLLEDLRRQLYDLQKVNGADDRYLFNALPVDVSLDPVEKTSSRLRSLILVLAGGAVLVIAVVSGAVTLDRRRLGGPTSDLKDRETTKQNEIWSPRSQTAQPGDHQDGLGAPTGSTKVGAADEPSGTPDWGF